MGAMNDGVSGFAIGLGKGVLGLVAQPVGGIVDFASNSLSVVQR
jgi:hypothetical protein